jgi:hypothetical protein
MPVQTAPRTALRNRWCAVRSCRRPGRGVRPTGSGWLSSTGMMANSIWRHCHRPCRRKAGGPTKGPADPATAELPWDKLRLSAVCPDYSAVTDDGAAGATDDGAGRGDDGPQGPRLPSIACSTNSSASSVAAPDAISGRPRRRRRGNAASCVAAERGFRRWCPGLVQRTGGALRPSGGPGWSRRSIDRQESLPRPGCRDEPKDKATFFFIGAHRRAEACRWFWRATSLRCISGWMVPSRSFWSKVSSSSLVRS